MRLRDGVDASKPVNIGQLQAWDLNTGKEVWAHDFQDSATFGPVLTTGSGLVFAGGTSDRKFRAFDGKTGQVLWEMTLNSGVIGTPSTFMVDNVQYVAVQAGWGVDAERAPRRPSGRLVAGHRQAQQQSHFFWISTIASARCKRNVTLL